MRWRQSCPIDWPTNRTTKRSNGSSVAGGMPRAHQTTHTSIEIGRSNEHPAGFSRTYSLTVGSSHSNKHTQDACRHLASDRSPTSISEPQAPIMASSTRESSLTLQWINARTRSTDGSLLFMAQNSTRGPGGRGGAWRGAQGRRGKGVSSEL